MIAPPVLNQYATLLTGHPVTVACIGDHSLPQGDLGMTYWYGDDPANPSFVQVIYLPTSTCKRIIAIITPPHGSPAARRLSSRIGTIVSPGTPDRASVDGVDVEADGRALETILHEATHLRENSTDEARVECDTHLNAWQAVKPLGLPAWRASSTLQAMTAAHEESEVSPIDYLAVC